MKHLIFTSSLSLLVFSFTLSASAKQKALFETIPAKAESSVQATSLGPSGIEAIIEFDATVVVPEDMALTQANMQKMAIKQTEHLLGVFETTQYTKIIGGRASDELGLLGLGPMVSVQVLSEGRGELGREVRYHAVQKVMANKKLIQAGETKAFPIYIPHDPEKIYALECTDPEYPEKEYFSFFWNPFQEGCPQFLIGQNKVDQVITRLVGLVPPDENSQPDYASLAAQIEQRGELRVSILIGFDEDWKNRRDEGRQSYNFLVRYYSNSGFEIVKRGDYVTKPFVDMVREATPRRPRVHLSISLTESDVDHPVIFAQRAREAYENSDVVMYAGHSGLGGSLDLEKITALSSPNPQQPTPIRFPHAYQILYFDSCASYYFYAHPYALAARGAGHVDVITDALSSYFVSQNGDVTRFVRALDAVETFVQDGTAPTWLQILTNVERSPGPTYLVNVLQVRQ
jgi:hypothetical protein